jgi:hypothetical protein
MISKWIKTACAVLGLFIWVPVVAEPSLRIALHGGGDTAAWPTFEQRQDRKNLPLVALDQPWPLEPQASEVHYPPAGIPVLLRLRCADISRDVSDTDLDLLAGLLLAHPDISHLVIEAATAPANPAPLAYLIKKISTQARSANAGIQIAVELSGEPDEASWLRLADRLVGDPDVAPYFNAFLCRSLSDQSRDVIWQKAPSIAFWEWCAAVGNAPDNVLKNREILSQIVAAREFEKQGIALLVVPVDSPSECFPFFSRFCAFLEDEMYRDADTIMVSADDGSSYPLPLFIRAKDLVPIVFMNTASDSRLKLSLEKGEYQEARIENLVSGERIVLPLRLHAKALLINRQSAFLAIELVPRSENPAQTTAQVDVQGRYHLTVEEIVAGVRAWDALQKNKLKSYVATMTLSLRLHIANYDETFDLTTRGPVFAERDKPYDWAWKEFYINGVKWKGKMAPKIPLLQPEKVSIQPFAINLTEGYEYDLAGETTFRGHHAYMIDFKPKNKNEKKASFQGRMYVDVVTFARLYERATQLNLKGDVLSNTEAQSIEPVPGAENIWLPLTIKGEQVFSIGGRSLNVERQLTLSKVEVNPPDLESRRDEVFQSKVQIVRDTEQGLRYLVKDKKTGERVVEWGVKKSQLAGVLGTFYDRSLSLPLPIAGFSYMNFNMDDKGKHLNLLFGGVLLTATYSDPAFLSTRANVGADIYAVAVPSSNSVYQRGSSVVEEKIRDRPSWLQVNFGFPLNHNLKFTSSFYAEYHHYSRSADTAADFVLPRSGLTFGAIGRLILDVNGYNLSFMGTVARRSPWDFWGRSDSSDFDPDQNSYVRWRLLLVKDFFLTKFRRLHLSAGYFDGMRLDRFSDFQFGFFNELKLHGFKSGSVRAERAWTLNTSFGYSFGEAFRLEAFYDSALVTDRLNGYKNVYFSGVGISGTTHVPGLRAFRFRPAGGQPQNPRIRRLSHLSQDVLKGARSPGGRGPAAEQVLAGRRFFPRRSCPRRGSR